MNREKIIFADPDEEYLSFLEGMIIPELEQKVEVILISNFFYFQKYVQVLEQNVLCFVCKEWGIELWQKMEGKRIFLIGEEEEEGLPIMVRSWDEQKIIQKIKNELARIRSGKIYETKRTKTLLIYSPIGGSGVSSVALESAKYLARRGKRVFFIGADTWQDYRKIVEGTLEKRAEEFFVTEQKGGFQVWKEWIWHGDFDALRPFAQSYSCLGLKPEFFRKIEKEVKEEAQYDWIVVETDHTYQEWMTDWMADADSIWIVIKQGEKWQKLLFVLEKSLCMVSREKFHFLYNFFHDEEKEEKRAKQLGWDAEIFLKKHGGTKEEWRQWADGIGELLHEM